MQRARLVRRPLRWRLSQLSIAVLVAVALFAGPRVDASSSITSHILIDPVGENFGDVFGSSVAWVGDVNGDGYDDLLIGAFHYPETTSIGQAYLYFGGPALDAVADLVIPAPAGGGGLFGASVAPAGDFNGDGYPDFIIGAPQAGSEGRAFIYYGGPSLDAIPDVTLIGESTGSLTMFGSSVASVGDVNGDGFDDVIVGAPHYGTTSGEWDGRAYVFFGGAVPDAVPDRVFSAVGAQDQLGTVVGSAGDMNGDGHPDLFASAPYNDTPVLNAGALYVWFGGPGFDATPDLVLHGSGVNERLSLTAANAGDVNNDGVSDLIGAEKDHVYVWFGGSSPNPIADLTFAGSYSSVAGAGDVNGDGVADFAVGAPNDVSGGLGRVSVYFGGSAVDTLEDLYYVGDSGGDIGLCIAGGGHVDGPGPSDLIVSAYYDPDSIGYNQGRVYVIANSNTCPGGTPVPPVNDSVSLVGDGSGMTINWTDSPGPYSVYRGTRSGGSPWAYNQTCHDSHIAASSATDSDNPSIGSMFFYLVTRVNACGESIPGRDSGGQPNPNPAPCP
jgi:hypothetical protein